VREVILKKGDRIFDHIYPFLVFMDSFYVSMRIHKDGWIEKDYSGYVTIEGKSTRMDVRLPIYGPVKSVVENKRPIQIEIVFLDKVSERPEERNVTSEIIEYIFYPLFINFYESVKSEMLIRTGSTPKYQNNWESESFRMGWLVRNSLSHDKKINFKDSTSRNIKWRGIVINQTNHDEPIHKHLNFTDIFILMFDIDEELNKKN
jgi:hypothetical protein